MHSIYISGKQTTGNFFATTLTLEMIVCSGCGRPNAEWLCGNCNACAYCSAECQQRDWSSHAYQCHVPLAGQQPIGEAAALSIVDVAVLDSVIVRVPRGTVPKAERSVQSRFVKLHARSIMNRVTKNVVKFLQNPGNDDSDNDGADFWSVPIAFLDATAKYVVGQVLEKFKVATWEKSSDNDSDGGESRFGIFPAMRGDSSSRPSTFRGVRNKFAAGPVIVGFSGVRRASGNSPQPGRTEDTLNFLPRDSCPAERIFTGENCFFYLPQNGAAAVAFRPTVSFEGEAVSKGNFTGEFAVVQIPRGRVPVALYTIQERGQADDIQAASLDTVAYTRAGDAAKKAELLSSLGMARFKDSASFGNPEATSAFDFYLVNLPRLLNSQPRGAVIGGGDNDSLLQGNEQPLKIGSALLNYAVFSDDNDNDDKRKDGKPAAVRLETDTAVLITGIIVRTSKGTAVPEFDWYGNPVEDKADGNARKLDISSVPVIRELALSAESDWWLVQPVKPVQGLRVIRKIVLT